MVEFLRRVGSRFSKLGKGRKKKQKWRRPTGRDNKMREKRKGYPAVVKIGYKQDKKLSGAINEKTPVIIMNLNDLKKIKKNEVVIIGKIGQKKKIEIAKIAKAKKIVIYNLNVEKFLHHQEHTKISKAKKVEEEKSSSKSAPSVMENKNTDLKPKSVPTINTKSKKKLEANTSPAYTKGHENLQAGPEKSSTKISNGGKNESKK